MLVMNSKKITLSAMFLAIGIILPFITMNIPVIGKMLLPMHIPVLLAGFIIGPVYGALLGVMTPLVRSFMFGVPYFYPNAVSMAFELMVYGLVSGIMYHLLFRKNNKIISIYISLITSMLLGRIIYGIVKVVMGIVASSSFTFSMFISYSLLNALPGIILQLILIPILIKYLKIRD